VPSTELGGDAFGYQWLTPDTFAFYLIDVSGHGVGAAMHSVSVLNVLRQRALPDVDFARPAQVLASLNDRYQMETHDGMYFTMWYGVYRAVDRSLSHSAAGHHPAYLVGPDRASAVPLGVSALMIGAMPEVTYEQQEATVAPGSSVYLFSDGVFEVATKDQELWNLSDFEPLMTAPLVAGTSEPDRLYNAVKEVARPGPLDDDFSLVTVTFQ
jgi:sigma-B regulation protein RsbU (phosphoserine phosphatase)